MTSRSFPSLSNRPRSVLVPAMLLAASTVLLAEPETWDPRLDDLGVFLEEADVPGGTMYWRLVSARYEDETEAGGTHHIYVRALDESGGPLEGQTIWQVWSTGSASAETKGPGIDDWWGNMPMAGGWCPFWPKGPRGPYGAHVDGASDTVRGMGLPCNRHVNYRLEFQWTRKSGAGAPAIAVSPATLRPSARQGEDASRQTFTVRNSGTGSLNYSISDDAAWLSVSPASGASSGESDTIAVTYETESRAPGAHHATITVTAAGGGATNSPQSVDVVLTITEDGGPGGGGNLISNGDFSSGLEGWEQWTERGAFSPAVSGGRARILADNVNGGVWQQFSTGGAGTTIPISGFWASDPTAPNNQWAEVLIVNSDRTPRDGQDVHESDADVVLVYKNDTWTTPGGWSGVMSVNAPVANLGEFAAEDDVATIVLKFGNIGGGETGALFDDIVVRGPSDPPPDTEPVFTRGDTNGDGRVDISDAVRTLIFLFADDGAGLDCGSAADANDDNAVDLSDAIRMLESLFADVPALTPVCGEDPTVMPEQLGCESYDACP